MAVTIGQSGSDREKSRQKSMALAKKITEARQKKVDNLTSVERLEYEIGVVEGYISSVQWDLDRSHGQNVTAATKLASYKKSIEDKKEKIAMINLQETMK